MPHTRVECKVMDPGSTLRAIGDDMLAQARHDRLVIPFAVADEKLNRLASHAVRGGDRLGGLTLQLAQKPFDDDDRIVTLLLTVEDREIGLKKSPKPSSATAHRSRVNLRIGQSRLRRMRFRRVRFRSR